MPPRTRTRATKDLKENVGVVKNTKIKSDGKIAKPPRKALADKTNSLSDDNASIDVPIKTSKAVLKNKAANTISKDSVRPRRDRRLPTRYVENQVLNNLSNSNNTPVINQTSVISGTACSKLRTKDDKVQQPPAKDNKQLSSKNEEVKLTTNRPNRNCRLLLAKEPPDIIKPETPSKQNLSICSPFKTPSQCLDSSLIASHPKRFCRLPPKFDDHLISPNKLIPVLPCHASTPIVKKKAKTVNKENVTKLVSENRRTRKVKKKDNNNDENTFTKRVISTKSPKKQSPKANIKTDFGKRILGKSFSFRVLEDRKSQDKDQDVYEFTYDPNEEPPPKKKRKKVVRKRVPKPKTVVLKNNYDKKVQIALESLKSKMKPSQPQNTQNPQTQSVPTNVPTDWKNTAGKITIIEDIIIKPGTVNTSLNYTPALPVNESIKSIHMSNYASIHVEDIAADFEQIDNDDINYSPVNSPCHPASEIQTENESQVRANDSHVIAVNKDPLNLQGDLSFFNEQPVASSSMNVSVRHPLASPWRVEFGNLPIRWQADTYVKPNMTPAVESSFVNSEENNMKKHVYTNLVAEEPFPQENVCNLKQPSIISFMREVAERSLKKKRARSISPTKANSLFEDMSNTNIGYKTSKKEKKETVLYTPNASNSSNDSCQKENSNENNENSNENNENSNPNSNHNEESPTKKSKKKEDIFFGFDESENYDQENVSPVKNIQHTRARGLQAKSRAVLQEINALSGPTRAVLPVTVKSKLPSSEAVEKLYDQLKSAYDAPQFPEKEKVGDETAANDEPSLSDDDDSQSMHLFEDIEVVHHLKVT